MLLSLSSFKIAFTDQFIFHCSTSACFRQSSSSFNPQINFLQRGSSTFLIRAAFLGRSVKLNVRPLFFCSVGEIYSVEKVLKQFLFLSHFFLSDFEFKSEFEHRPKKGEQLFLFSDRGESRTQDSGSRCAST